MLGLGATTKGIEVGGVDVDGVEFRDTGLRDLNVNKDPTESALLPAVLAAQKGLLSCVIGASTLGKLSRYVSSGDRRRRLSLALMAAPLWRSCMATSIVHPHRLCDFAVYTPTPASVLSGVDLFMDRQRLSPRACMDALEHACTTLVEQGEGLMALPLLSLLECLSSGLCMEPTRTLRVRVLRVDALSQAGLIAQAVSVLAGILTGAALGRVAGSYGGATMPKGAGTFANAALPGAAGYTAALVEASGVSEGYDAPTAEKLLEASLPNPAYPNTGGSGEDLAQQQEYTRPGLPFYGLAPYQQHLPPDAPENAAALDWVAAVKIGPAGSGGGHDAGAAAAAAAAAAPASPAKGKKGAPSPAADGGGDGGASGGPTPAVLRSGVAGSGDLAEWLSDYVGGAGRRALALARGRLLLAMTEGMGVGKGGTEPYAHVVGRLRGAADAMATAVGNQAVFAAFMEDNASVKAMAAEVEATLVGGGGGRGGQEPSHAGEVAGAGGDAGEAAGHLAQRRRRPATAGGRSAGGRTVRRGADPRVVGDGVRCAAGQGHQAERRRRRGGGGGGGGGCGRRQPEGQQSGRHSDRDPGGSRRGRRGGGRIVGS
jgi:hypothetical protein